MTAIVFKLIFPYLCILVRTSHYSMPHNSFAIQNRPQRSHIFFIFQLSQMHAYRNSVGWCF